MYNGLLFYAPVGDRPTCQELLENGEKYGLTSYKFNLNAKSNQIAAKFWFVRRTGLAIGFNDGVIFKAMENSTKIGPPRIVSIHPENL